MPEARTVSTSSLTSTSLGAGARTAVQVLLVTQEPEYYAQFVLGRSADIFNGFEGGAGLLRAFGHEAPADPGLDRDHREGVGDDVVQLAGDAHPLLPDVLPGAFGLGGSLALRLLSESGQVAPPGRDAVADEPGRCHRYEACHRLASGRCGPDRERRVHQRRAKRRRRRRGREDRRPSGQLRSHEVDREPEHEAERQRGVTRGRDHSRRRRRDGEHGQRPSSQQHDRAAHQESEDNSVVRRMGIGPGRQGQHRQSRARGEHDRGRPLAIAKGHERVPPGRIPGQMIPSHSTDRNASMRVAHQPGERRRLHRWSARGWVPWSARRKMVSLSGRTFRLHRLDQTEAAHGHDHDG